MASNITPGLQQYGETATGIHVTTPDGSVKKEQPVKSVTQDPFTPVEFGRTSAKSKYTTTNSSGNDIPSQSTRGPVASVTLTGTSSGKGDGTQTARPTTSNIGTGCTITYSVSSNVASGTTVAAGGTNYEVGDLITISDDPGVTYTVATIS